MKTPAEAEIVIYALGGGMGHLVRSASLARAIHRSGGPRPAVLASPGFTHMVEFGDFEFQMIEPTEDPSAYRAIILESLHKLNPKVFITDALPMGLMGELRDYLPEFEGKKALIARLLRQDYRENLEVDEFVRNNYDIVIRAEPLPRSFLRHPRSVAVHPILALDSASLPTRQKARKILKVPDDRFLVMAVGTDVPDRVDAFFQLAHRSTQRVGNPRAVLKFASPYGNPSPASAHTCYCPLMELLPGADLVVGHAGYHLFHECLAAGVPALLFPRPRLYDDQEQRVKNWGQKNWTKNRTKNRGHNLIFEKNKDCVPGFLPVTTFQTPEELENGIRRYILHPPKRRPRRKKSPNGAEKAAQIILELL